VVVFIFWCSKALVLPLAVRDHTHTATRIESPRPQVVVKEMWFCYGIKQIEQRNGGFAVKAPATCLVDRVENQHRVGPFPARRIAPG